jgi:hypothetical protein
MLPFPLIVVFVEDRFIWEVPALNARLAVAVGVKPKFIGVLNPSIVSVDEPRLIEVVFAPVANIYAAVTAKLAVEKAPFTTLTPAFIPRFAALPKDHPQPTPLIRMTSVFEVRATPFVVNVLPVVEPDNTMPPVILELTTPVAANVTFP